jgi:hypothetical protein
MFVKECEMSSPKIEKLIIYSAEGPARVYKWNKEALTFAELIACLSTINKMPDESHWLDEGN